MGKLIETISAISACCRGEELFKQRAFAPTECDNFFICEGVEILKNDGSQECSDKKETDGGDDYESIPILDVTYDEEKEESEYYQELMDDENLFRCPHKISEIEMVPITKKTNCQIATIDDKNLTYPKEPAPNRDWHNETQILQYPANEFTRENPEEMLDVTFQEHPHICISSEDEAKRTIIITSELVESLKSLTILDSLYDSPWILDDMICRFMDWLENNGLYFFAVKHIEDDGAVSGGTNIIATPFGKWTKKLLPCSTTYMNETICIEMSHVRQPQIQTDFLPQHQMSITYETNLGYPMILPLGKLPSCQVTRLQPILPRVEGESFTREESSICPSHKKLNYWSTKQHLYQTSRALSYADQSPVKYISKKESRLAISVKKKSHSLLKKIFSNNRENKPTKKRKKKRRISKASKASMMTDVTDLTDSTLQDNLDNITDASTCDESLDTSHIADFSPFSNSYPSGEGSLILLTSLNDASDSGVRKHIGSNFLFSFLGNDPADLTSGSQSLQNALDCLISCNILTRSPSDIAHFIQVYRQRIGAAVLGDFLARGGDSEEEMKYHELIRYYYISSRSFSGMAVEQGLRFFLTERGFRLPGESQKIDRLVCTFSRCFWEDNGGNQGLCRFQHQDTIYLLSFAIILLNTDLHKKTSKRRTKMKRRNKRMTKNDFCNNIMGIEYSDGLSREYLSGIYDSISSDPITLLESDDIHRRDDFEGNNGQDISNQDSKKEKKLKNPLSRNRRRFRRQKTLEFGKF